MECRRQGIEFAVAWLRARATRLDERGDNAASTVMYAADDLEKGEKP